MKGNNEIKQWMVKHQLLTKAIGVGMLALLIAILGISSLFMNIQKLGKTIRAKELEEKKLSEKVVLLSKIDKEVLKERIDIIKDALPAKKDVFAYLTSLDGLSRKLGLSFGGITVSPGDVTENAPSEQPKAKSKSSRSAGLQVLDTTIKVEGNRDAIYEFLKQVEQTLPLMQVSEIKVSASDLDLYSLSLALGMLWAPDNSVDVKGAVSLFNEDEEQNFQLLSKFSRYNLADLSGDENASGSAYGKLDLFSE